MRLVAHRFTLLALGRAWILLGSRKNLKPEKCSKMRQNLQRPVHAVLGGTSRLFGSQILVFHFPGMIERVKGGVPYQVPQRPLAGQFTL